MPTFLFLQGPHGPFFMQLAKMLRKTGAKTLRIGFNRGDQHFWKPASEFIAFQDDLSAWPDRFKTLVETHTVTDIVLYGDTRPIHKMAIDIARDRGLRIHVFEEGYIRPFWVTYERDGSNGNSRLMQTTVADMQSALQETEHETPMPPSHWGDMRQHIYYGAAYHWWVMFANRKYPKFTTHRDIAVRREFQLYFKRLIMMPYHRIEREIRTFRIVHGQFPYHLVLLQLEHDSAFQMHSPFSKMSEFLETTVRAFAQSAPNHHHLVFKAHPLEDGRAQNRATLHRLAKEHGLENRIHYVRGGKLAKLLDQARSAVTVNSTAGQQVLWRGIPLKIFGKTVYDKPEFVSDQNIQDFFAKPKSPDARAYRDYRSYLLATSQVAGGFYSAKGRRQLIRLIVDRMLSPYDPYDALNFDIAAPKQHIPTISVIGSESTSGI